MEFVRILYCIVSLEIAPQTNLSLTDGGCDGHIFPNVHDFQLSEVDDRSLNV